MERPKNLPTSQPSPPPGAAAIGYDSADATDATEASHASNPSSLPASKRRPLPCEGCRGQRRKCDLIKPSCSRCIERGLICHYGTRKTSYAKRGTVPAAGVGAHSVLHLASFEETDTKSSHNTQSNPYIQSFRPSLLPDPPSVSSNQAALQQSINADVQQNYLSRPSLATSAMYYSSNNSQAIPPSPAAASSMSLLLSTSNQYEKSIYTTSDAKNLEETLFDPSTRSPPSKQQRLSFLEPLTSRSSKTTSPEQPPMLPDVEHEPTALAAVSLAAMKAGRSTVTTALSSQMEFIQPTSQSWGEQQQQGILPSLHHHNHDSNVHGTANHPFSLNIPAKPEGVAKKTRGKNPCASCKVHKKKCDGNQPCSYCAQRKVECRYPTTFLDNFRRQIPLSSVSAAAAAAVVVGGGVGIHHLHRPLLPPPPRLPLPSTSQGFSYPPHSLYVKGNNMLLSSASLPLVSQVTDSRVSAVGGGATQDDGLASQLPPEIPQNEAAQSASLSQSSAAESFSPTKLDATAESPRLPTQLKELINRLSNVNTSTNSVTSNSIQPDNPASITTTTTTTTPRPTAPAPTKHQSLSMLRLQVKMLIKLIQTISIDSPILVFNVLLQDSMTHLDRHLGEARGSSSLSSSLASSSSSVLVASASFADTAAKDSTTVNSAAFLGVEGVDAGLVGNSSSSSSSSSSEWDQAVSALQGILNGLITRVMKEGEEESEEEASKKGVFGSERNAAGSGATAVAAGGGAMATNITTASTTVTENSGGLKMLLGTLLVGSAETAAPAAEKGVGSASAAVGVGGGGSGNQELDFHSLKCQNCKLQFENVSELQKHHCQPIAMMKHTSGGGGGGGGGTPGFTCPDCHKFFKTQGGIKYHRTQAQSCAGRKKHTE
ncbi:hypothetical protein BDR26DRAFT_425461 [Obelidium mucronatum]|nr:hypothetical protein BDR26DRAFT_425461 [Obelidium mucronatum]